MRQVLYPILDYKISTNSQKEDQLRETKPQSKYLVSPPDIQKTIVSRYNGKPADIIYKNNTFTSRPYMLDEYGDDYVNGRDLQIINSTNRRPVEVSGYLVHPKLIDKSPFISKSTLIVKDILL